MRRAVMRGVLLRSRPLTASTAGTTAACPLKGWRPDRQPATHASAQQDDRVAEADADNDAAVAAYRLSVQVGNPFSERKLAQTFGRTSRRWARARIAEARQSLTEREPAGLASIADGLPNIATDRALGRAFHYGR